MSHSPKSRARAVADVDGGTILASVEIMAPIERVFRAITTAEVTEWWGSPDTYRTTSWTADVRPGGKWRAEGKGNDGSAFHVEGEYVEVEAPRRIVHTWRAPWDGNNETRVTYKLEPIDGGTRVTLRHTGFADRAESCRSHGEGWERVLGWLDAYAGPAEERAYMVRLLPPRPSFANDMTPDEAEMMRAHGMYWRGLRDQGKALLFGPVADPAGPWGLGVLRAPTEEALHAMRDGDPVAKSGRGFTYEIVPMMRVVT